MKSPQHPHPGAFARRVLRAGAALLLVAAVAACGTRRPAEPEPPEPPETPPSAQNSLVMPAIGWGTTAKGLQLTTADDRCDGVPQAIRQAVQDNLAAPYEHLLPAPTPDTTSAPRLSVEITDILANAGGVYGGPKMVEVRGTLTRAGQPPLRFSALRQSFMRLGGWNTTCGMLSRVTYALGTDIAAWLQKPVDGAVLGDR